MPALPCGDFRDAWEYFFYLFLHAEVNCEKGCLITKFEYRVVLRQAVWYDMKNIDFHILP